VWKTIQIIFGVIGLLAAFAGGRFSMPVLLYGGIMSLGFMAIAIGWEAIITQHMVLGSRRRGTRQTYTGLAAILQRIQFNLIGIFFIGLSAMMCLSDQDEKNIGREIFLQFVRRPGIPLVGLGMLLLMQAVIELIGSRESKQGSRWIVTLNLFSRLLPGGILVVLGLGALGLGVFEIMTPDTFDEMGGGFLEVLYGVRE
jgi:hypothetical protein